MEKSIILMLLFLPLAGLASHRCIVEDYLYRGSTSSAGICEVGEPLRIETKEMYYRFLNTSPYRVRYWEGSYETTVKTIWEYERYTTNACTHQEIGRDPVQFETLSKKSFGINNPNLRDDVRHSYELAPLTDEEALIEYRKAKEECEAYAPAR